MVRSIMLMLIGQGLYGRIDRANDPLSSHSRTGYVIIFCRFVRLRGHTKICNTFDSAYIGTTEAEYIALSAGTLRQSYRELRNFTIRTPITKFLSIPNAAPRAMRQERYTRLSLKTDKNLHQYLLSCVMIWNMFGGVTNSCNSKIEMTE